MSKKKGSKAKYWYGYQIEAKEKFNISNAQISYWVAYPSVNPEFTEWIKERAKEIKQEKINKVLSELM